MDGVLSCVKSYWHGYGIRAKVNNEKQINHCCIERNVTSYIRLGTRNQLAQLKGKKTLMGRTPGAKAKCDAVSAPVIVSSRAGAYFFAVFRDSDQACAFGSLTAPRIMHLHSLCRRSSATALSRLHEL